VFNTIPEDRVEEHTPERRKIDAETIAGWTPVSA